MVYGKLKATFIAPNLGVGHGIHGVKRLTLTWISLRGVPLASKVDGMLNPTCANAAMNLAEKMPYVNLLQAEPTARFLDLTHDRYAQHLGHDLGRHFMATFTDEPSLMSLFLQPMPYRVLPWAASLPAEFQRRRGYAIDGILPALVADTGPRGQGERFDYWQTIGELVSDNYFGQIQNWCHEHHTLSGGHLLMEEGQSRDSKPSMNTPLLLHWLNRTQSSPDWTSLGCRW